MLTLKMKQATYNEVNYEDLERLVHEVYDQPGYSLVADIESGNDFSYTFSVCKEEIDNYDLEKLQLFRDTGLHHSLIWTLLADLCNQEIIPEGNYLISISW